MHNTSTLKATQCEINSMRDEINADDGEHCVELFAEAGVLADQISNALWQPWTIERANWLAGDAHELSLIAWRKRA